MIGWWCKWPTTRNPGRRLRAELVMRGLRERGLPVEWFDPANPDRYRCVVLMRRDDVRSEPVIDRLQASGCRLVLDLCDNYFVYPPGKEKLAAGAERVRRLAARVDQVVVASKALAEVVTNECALPRAPVVIGDLADDLSIVPLGIFERLGGVLALWRARRWLGSKRALPHTRLVWFGDKGGSWAQVGLPDLASLKPVLEALHAEFPLQLTVISNSRKRYRALLGDLRIPHHYENWNAGNFLTLLGEQDVTLIPASVNAFTRCKTDNRVVTSLTAGVAVVASAIPSYEPYSGVVAIGDIEAGLRRYLADPGRRRADILHGKALAIERSAAGPILDAWQRVLDP